MCASWRIAAAWSPPPEWATGRTCGRADSVPSLTRSRAGPRPRADVVQAARFPQADKPDLRTLSQVTAFRPCAARCLAVAWRIAANDATGVNHDGLGDRAPPDPGRRRRSIGGTRPWARAIAAPIRIGEINSYTAQPAFLQPYRNGWTLALEQVNAAGGVNGPQAGNPAPRRCRQAGGRGAPGRRAGECREGGAAGRAASCRMSASPSPISPTRTAAVRGVASR